MIEKVKGIHVVFPPFVVIDFETTGFSNKEDEIIEYGGILIGKDWKPKAVFSELAYPMYKNIPLSVTKLTGIDTNLLKKEKADLTFFVMERFLDFVGGYPVVGHNVKFDIGFIDNALLVRDFDKHKVFNNPIIDTLSMARFLVPGLPSYNLENLCYNLGIKGEKYHRALDDVESTFKLYQKLLKILEEKQK